MATSSSPKSVRSVLKELESKLGELYAKLKGEPCTENANFDLEEFWKYFAAATKVLSHEATKFSMAFSKPPLPSVDDCQVFSNRIECAVQNVVTSFLSLPQSKGRTLQDELYKFVVPVVLAMKDLCAAAGNVSANVLQPVGNVWEKCEIFNSLSRDNKDAVLAVCSAEHSLVDDAVVELVDALENETEGSGEDELRYAFMQNGIRIPCPNKWSDSDRDVVHSSLGLIKVYRTCLKKTSSTIREKASATDESSILELDGVASIVKSSSSFVDDLASSLYPPLCRSAIMHHAEAVHSTCKNLLAHLEKCSQFISEAEVTWINFLQRALQHNWDLINERVVEQ